MLIGLMGVFLVGCRGQEHQTISDGQSQSGKNYQEKLRDLSVATLIKKTNANRPLVFSHRGSIYDYPEHSFAGYDSAIKSGTAFIEQDVYLSKDQHLFVSHDDNLNRTTQNNINITESNAKDLQQIQLGNGEHLHELKDVFKRYGSKIHYIIEAKRPASSTSTLVNRQLVEEIKKYHMSSNVIIQDTLMQGLEIVHKIKDMNNVPLLYLYLGDDIAASIDSTPKFIKFYSIPWTNATPALIEQAHRKGFLINLWTINEYTDNTTVFKQLKPDSVFTNETKVTFKIMKELDLL